MIQYTQFILKGAFILPLLLMSATTAQAQTVSSSSSSSAFVNSAGAGASSSAVSISPTGTFSSNQSTFTPGATSSSASATATASTTGPNFATATVNAPALPNGGITGGFAASPLSVASPVNVSSSVNASTAVTNSSTALISTLANTINPSVLSPTITFIPSFQTPLQLQTTTASTSNQVITGMPSRVFPGLGLYYAPE